MGLNMESSDSQLIHGTIPKAPVKDPMRDSLMSNSSDEEFQEKDDIIAKLGSSGPNSGPSSLDLELDLWQGQFEFSEELPQSGSSSFATPIRDLNAKVCLGNLICNLTMLIPSFFCQYIRFQRLIESDLQIFRFIVPSTFIVIVGSGLSLFFERYLVTLEIHT